MTFSELFKLIVTGLSESVWIIFGDDIFNFVRDKKNYLVQTSYNVVMVKYFVENTESACVEKLFII